MKAIAVRAVPVPLRRVGSDPDAEWQETRNKLRSLLDPIAHWSE